jgi:hypothetical protein
MHDSKIIIVFNGENVLLHQVLPNKHDFRSGLGLGELLSHRARISLQLWKGQQQHGNISPIGSSFGFASPLMTSFSPQVPRV